jgi:hypothetical protein
MAARRRTFIETGLASVLGLGLAAGRSPTDALAMPPPRCEQVQCEGPLATSCIEAYTGAGYCDWFDMYQCNDNTKCTCP